MSLQFSHIAHSYGSTRALENISFTAPTGEITCLLGSSGCGKSTLLNLAAGLLDVQSGTIAIQDTPLAQAGYNPNPEQRPVGMVFQDGALFPHMTIARNIAFGLPKERHGEITSWLGRVGLAGLGERYPHQLSGGQQQRAALARAMAPDPQVLLMDEPFASVDIVLRRRLRRDCRLLLRERGTTTLLVTHDPDEALDIADRIAVMEAGHIVQFGTPQELYSAPATPSVGAIFGGSQIVRAKGGAGALSTAFGDWPVETLDAKPVEDGAMLDLLVHARALRLEADPQGVPARDLHSLGDSLRVLLRHDSGAELTVEVPQATAAHLRQGERYRVIPDEGSIRAFAS